MVSAEFVNSIFDIVGSLLVIAIAFSILSLFMPWSDSRVPFIKLRARMRGPLRWGWGLYATRHYCDVGDHTGYYSIWNWQTPLTKYDDRLFTRADVEKALDEIYSENRRKSIEDKKNREAASIARKIHASDNVIA